MLKKFIQMVLPECVKTADFDGRTRKESLCLLYPIAKMMRPTARHEACFIIKKEPAPTTKRGRLYSRAFRLPSMRPT